MQSEGYPPAERGVEQSQRNVSQQGEVIVFHLRDGTEQENEGREGNPSRPIRVAGEREGQGVIGRESGKSREGEDGERS